MAATLPLLAPPQPRFPTRFSQTEDTGQHLEATGSWPEEVGEQEREFQEVGGGVEWSIKTAAEEHVERLEAKLADLRSAPPPSLSDSGHASMPADSLALGVDDDLDNIYEHDEPGGTDSQAVGDEEEEGQPLLSSVNDPGSIDDGARGRSSVPPLKRNPTSSSRSRDEDADTSDNDGVAQRHLPFRIPSTAAHNSQRISFSNSVRIGGRHGSKHHRHQLADAFVPPAPTERTSLLAPLPRPISAPSALLVASVTASSSPSRSVSPGPSHSRRPSLTAYSHLPNAYSTSPTSYGASRSSSPCSSIYAPLQPPSRFCPNPMFVRPAGAAGSLRRSRSGSMLSFQEYLRSGGRIPFDPDDDDSDEDELGSADEEQRAEYRELVEQQRRRKARWEAKRRKRPPPARRESHERVETGGGGFWDRLSQLLVLGIAGSGSGRGAAVNVVVAPPTPLGRGSSPARPSPLRRRSSSDSLASDDDEPPRRSRPFSSSSTKTEADVRFGPAPGRYFRLDWLKHKLAELVQAARRALATAAEGWRRAMGEGREREREQGYEAV
ncbi:hypothetical protein JCM10207_006444 [Rhodosporidiobolus poonsookiae]